MFSFHHHVYHLCGCLRPAKEPCHLREGRVSLGKSSIDYLWSYMFLIVCVSYGRYLCIPSSGQPERQSVNIIANTKTSKTIDLISQMHLIIRFWYDYHLHRHLRSMFQEVDEDVAGSTHSGEQVGEMGHLGWKQNSYCWDKFEQINRWVTSHLGGSVSSFLAKSLIIKYYL